QSADRRTIALVTSEAIHVADLATGKELRRIDATGPNEIHHSALSDDGKLLAAGVGMSERTLRVWDVATGKEVTRGEGVGFVSAVAFTPDGRHIAAATGWRNESRLLVFETITGRRVLEFRGHEALVTALAFAPDGRRLAAGMRDSTAL